MRTIDADALLKRVDEEREFLKARMIFGAEHILVHNFRELIVNAPTVRDNFDEGYVKGLEDGRAEKPPRQEPSLYWCSLAKAHCGFSRPQGEWIPISERLPEQNGLYITTCRDICENRVHAVMFDGVRKKWGRGGVIAWQPLPEPYQKGGAEDD